MSAADGGAATNESWWREYGSRRQARLESPPTAAAQHQKLAGRWPSLLLLFFCLFFVSSLPATVRADVVCAHANSTCSDCAALCAVAQFFPLLPSPCHPEFPAVSPLTLLVHTIVYYFMSDTLVTVHQVRLYTEECVRKRRLSKHQCPPPSLSRDPLTCSAFLLATSWCSSVKQETYGHSLVSLSMMC